VSAAALWSLLTSRVAGPLAAALATLLACLLAAALVGQAVQKTRLVALERDRDGWKTAAGRWEASAKSLREAFDAAEAMRAKEMEAAQRAVAEAGKTCEARVVAARRSARAIDTIIRQEVSRDANGCPARGLVPGGRLRDALVPGG